MRIAGNEQVDAPREHGVHEPVARHHALDADQVWAAETCVRAHPAFHPASGLKQILFDALQIEDTPEGAGVVGALLVG